MTDLRTLKLVGGTVDTAELQQYIRYQQVLLSALQRHPATEWPGRLAFSHSEAMRATGFDDEQKLQRLRVTVTQFCGRAWVVRELALKKASTKDSAVLERIAKETGKVGDFSEFIERYGQSTFDALKANEEVLVNLHQALASSEGKGHLHLA
ncbi:MAG: hypothetical protein K1X64_08810 [Myxococcaceae bacterium]|nr:hypothetical protein [Myxococcaceae bacterium]